MTADSKHDDDDRLLSELLRPLDVDAAPLDRTFSDRLQQRLAAELRQSGQHRMTGDSGNSAEDVLIISSGRDRKMLTLTARLVLSITAACIGGFAWMTAWFGASDAIGSVTLDDVLQQTVQSETLQLKVVRNGTEADVWVRNHEGRSTDVRWEESPSSYRIVNGSRLWEIDEENNTVRADTQPWFRSHREETSVDLLAMLGVEEAAGRFRKVRAVGQVRHAGRDCRVFRMRSEQDDEQLLIEAFADAETNELLMIAAWPDGLRRQQKTPLAELRLIARNEPVDESKFAVAKSLSNDGRIGRVLDAQGIVMLRPVMRSRWTPIARQMLIRSGDWLRTDVRGANAAAVAMTSQFRLVAGPGSLVELQNPRQVFLHGGEVQITGSDHADEELTLLAPNNQKIVLKAGESGLFRLLADRTLRKIESRPVWLAGFEGASNEESIGSLIANVDGRNVPLTVGYHKVSVEIRDQIARTTIEESFVNRTKSRLEGVFHFPLPQDASISGFGMWIGNELVEADVVEKQRAREIYETILRERRDPGLLEWTGGNIFKARVFPIEAHSEKRIRIVYTQVLPLQGNRYRYSYALRSELLQKTPLRELSINVLVNSELPLRSVACPTHSVRSTYGGPIGGGGGTIRSANLEFAAQEYSPTRDFEVVCELDSKQSDVVLIPHQRGDDGYFLAQVTLPSTDGNWQREVLPDGEPLDVLLVCDTSASMDSDSRRKQEEFVAAILASLGPEDRFNLAVCDVECHWLFEDSVPAGVENEKAVMKARQWLKNRVSLGWTDLDQAFTSIQQRADAGSHVIYIGDGIVTSGDADPQAFASRLNGQTLKSRGQEPAGDAGTSSHDARPTFHAVSVSSSFESVVLKAIAGIGGGSVRTIGGEQTSQVVAFELLNEIAQPGLTDVKIEFRGLQVAAVYPERLPNLAAGTQQIIVGRYLPQGADQTGEMIVTGKRGDEPVRYAARVSLRGAESGNSFIPRLWARAHLDQLLQQGTSQLIRDEIIGLSEEFHIITPYTSLLVLETDADRERFGVTRRFQMRDGERFFAEGRDDAHYELLQEQMKKAGDWRMDLRRAILAKLARLGRSTREIQAWRQIVEQGSSPGSIHQLDRIFAVNGTARIAGSVTSQPLSFSGPVSSGGASTYGFYSGFGGGDASGPVVEHLGLSPNLSGDRNGVWDAERDLRLLDTDDDLLIKSSHDFPEGSSISSDIGRSTQDFDLQQSPFSSPQMASSPQVAARLNAFKPGSVGLSGAFEAISDGRRLRKRLPQSNVAGEWFQRRSNLHPESSEYVNWMNTQFPTLPSVVTLSRDRPESRWSDEAIEVSRKLLQPHALTGRDAALEISIQSEVFDARWSGRKTSEHRTIELISKDRWLRRTTSAPGQTLVDWREQDSRGILSRAFLLGRIRNLNESGDDSKKHLTDSAAAAPWSQSPLHQAFVNHSADIERQGDRIILLLTMIDHPEHRIRLTIDSTRDVVLRVEHLHHGATTSETVYGDYRQVAGSWWPTRKETLDGKGRRTGLEQLSVVTVGNDEFLAKFEDELSPRDSALIIEAPLPSMRQAEVAVEEGSAGIEERLVLLLRSAWVQNWDDVFEQLEQLEKLAPGKPGVRWVRAAVLRAARRNEDVRRLLESLSGELVDGRDDEYFLATHILSELSQSAAAEEQLVFLDRLQPVFTRLPEYTYGTRDWQIRRVSVLRNLGRRDDYLALQESVASVAPWDVMAQGQFARDLADAGEFDRAYQWLRKELDRDAERNEFEISQLRRVYADLLGQHSRSEELVTFLQEWVDAGSENQQLYAEYLSALNTADRHEEANSLVKQWLSDGQIEGELTDAALAKFQAALSFALGQRHHYSLNYILPEWIEPLVDTAEFFLQHEHHFSFSRRILDSYYFRQTDEYGGLIRRVAELLSDSGDTLPVDVLTSMVSWCLPTANLTDEDWLETADQLHQRWSSLDEAELRKPFGDLIVQILRARSANDRLLPFMRDRITGIRALEDADDAAAEFTLALFNELLARDWSEAYEIEAFELLNELTAVGTTAASVMVQVESLHRLTDAMLQARFRASMTNLLDSGHPEDLTRTELAAKQNEFRRAARTGLADRLAAESERRRKGRADGDQAAALLDDWFQIERLYLDVSLDRRTQEATEECWRILGDKPSNPLSPDDLDQLDEQSIQIHLLRDILKRRALVMLMNLSARRSAPKELSERVLKYIETAIELEQAAGSEDEGASWKNFKFELLIAHDRPEELERSLRSWISDDDYSTPWQLTLGRLLAERGRIQEAIGLFESVEKKTLLSGADYEALSDWYLVADQRPKYEEAKVNALLARQEYELNNWIQQQLNQWQRQNASLPDELDPRVVFAFKALFTQSQNPENYISQLRYFYRACRDFRLLKVVPDIVTGRTSQQIYPLLGRIHSTILAEVRDEATADGIIEGIHELRGNPESTVVDRRALDLLEAMVERKSSELTNQPGIHVDASVAALKRAFEREWADGERRQMADFLKTLGRISQERLADEQMRQLEALHAGTEPGTDDRLWIAFSLASCHFSSYGRRDEGMAIMENAIREFDVTHDDGWPLHASEPLSGYVSFLEQVSRFAQAEQFIDRYLETPLNTQSKYWFLRRQNQVCHAALRAHGRVSLGEGRTLYRKLVERIIEQAQRMDAPSQYEMLSDLSNVFRSADQLQIDGVKSDLYEFATRQLPPFLKQQTHQYTTLVDQFARTLHSVSGPRYGVKFLVDRVETWPDRFRHTWQDGWNRCGHHMAKWFHDSEKILVFDRETADLEERLLKIVLAALRQELTSGRRYSSYFFRKHYAYFWNEKVPDFARVAEEVLNEKPDSSGTVSRVSDYLWSGLDHFDRAIEIRLIALPKGLVSASDRYELATWLHHENRWAEAIPVLEPMVEETPDEMKYRTALLKSYARSSRPEQRDRLLEQIDEHFRGGGRWTESNLALLASTCVEVQLDEAAVQYYDELIPLAQRSRRNRGIGEGTVSNYYELLSESHSRLGHTQEAIDAASGAIIAWGPRHDRRTSAINQMKSVVSRAQNLDEYVASLDRQFEESGQDSPLIRRIIGEVYAQRGEHEKAVVQLQLAVELQPFDPEVHQALIRSYDALDDTDAAIRQIVRQLDFDRHNLELYKDLARRLSDDKKQSERAVTTIVEAAPREAEHHEALALIRQDQNRWSDAIEHWQHVAELRALEPTGLLKLAEAQIHEERWTAARTTIDRLKSRAWPSRFSNVESQARQLENRIKP